MSETTWVAVGVLGRAHGIRGEVVVDLRTDEPEARFAVGTLLRAESGGRTYTVASLRWHGERLLVHFAELPDRTAAEAARGTVLLGQVDAREEPADPDEFYDRHLIGLEVRVDGRPVGKVTDVAHSAQDLLTVEVDGADRLVPFVEALVPEIHVAEGWLAVADIPGLLFDEPGPDHPRRGQPAGSVPEE